MGVMKWLGIFLLAVGVVKLIMFAIMKVREKNVRKKSKCTDNSNSKTS